MKAEKVSPTAQAVILGFLLSFGAVGSAVTGLKLQVTDMGRIALLCACTACAAGLLSRVRFGGWLVSALILGAAVGIWRIEAWQAQTVDLLCRVTRYYNNAYGWVVVRSPLEGNGLMDWPVGCFAVWIAAANCWNLSKGVGNQTGILAAALPLIASVVVTDTVPQSLYLYLWLLGLILVLLSGGLRRQDSRWGVYMVRLAALPTALALGMLFWAVPREGYDRHPDALQKRIVDWVQELPDLWNQVQEDVAAGLDGAVQPQIIRLDTLGPRLKRVYPVMEVTAPVSGTVYLRGQHYDTYTAEGWTVSAPDEEYFPSNSLDRELGEITIRTRRARDVLYLPYYPAGNVGIVGGRVDNHEGLRQYSFMQNGLPSSWRAMVNAMTQHAGSVQHYPGSLTPEQMERQYLKLPEQTRQWAEGYLDRILSDERTATDVADTIGECVRGSARYDLDTPRMDGEYDDFARWFLEESETGYCVHFATAATVLLRAAGVEARYVEGYMFSARMGGETTVTADQAHAWAEYYEPLLGAWIVLEATPADLGAEVVTQPETQTPAPTETEPEETQLPQTRPEETRPREDAPVLPQEGQGPSEPVDLGWLWNALAWVLTTVLTGLALEAQRRLRLCDRQRRFRRGSRRKQALERYRELERLCGLLKRDIPEQATHLAEKAKYSRRGPEEAELAELDAMLESVRAALKEEPWYRKILYKFIFAAF